jgi:hypothetical protein
MAPAHIRLSMFEQSPYRVQGDCVRNSQCRGRIFCLFLLTLTIHSGDCAGGVDIVFGSTAFLAATWAVWSWPKALVSCGISDAPVMLSARPLVTRNDLEGNIAAIRRTPRIGWETHPARRSGWKGVQRSALHPCGDRAAKRRASLSRSISAMARSFLITCRPTASPRRRSPGTQTACSRATMEFDPVSPSQPFNNAERHSDGYDVSSAL